MKRKKLEKKSFLKAVIALAVALAFVMPGAAAFANVGTFGVTTNLENTDTINNIVEDGEGPIDKREVTSDTSDVVEDAVLGSGGNIIYVGSGPGNDSATIQEGINLANPGDTVYVYNGIYYEHLTVDISINLIGESKEGTIVDGSGGADKILYVTADNVNVSSFTIRNGNLYGPYFEQSSYSSITNCIVTSITFGIYFRGGEYNSISDCISYGNNGYGIYIYGDPAGSGYSTVTNCTCYNNKDGILIRYSGDNIITNNTCHNNSEYGIYSDYRPSTAGPNKIYHNNFVDNTVNDACANLVGPSYFDTWDNGYPSGGNYYSEYSGVDNNHGPGQNIPGSDGIGDTAYGIPAPHYPNSKDNYPLMNPWGPPPPEITDVTATPESQSIGGNVNITCTAEDVHNGVKQAIVYITDPTGSQQEFEMTGITVDYLGNGEYYYNATYSTIGMYSYFIRAENWRDCGNESDMYEFKIKGSDTVPPVTNCTLMGTVGENDWYVSDVEVNLTVTDPPPSSGINYTTYKLDENNWTEYTNPFTVTTDGSHTVEYYSVDIAGNVESNKSVSFKIDQTAPETSYELYPPEPDGENDWYVKLTATDDTSRVNYTMYKLDENNWTEYTNPFTVTTDRTHTVEYYSVDMAGNIESNKSVSFKIDQTAPETSYELYPPEPDGENDWYVSDVEVNLTVTDPPPSSGINYTTYKLDENNWTEYTNPFTVTTDRTHTVEYYSVDIAGNVESNKSVSFKIDQTAPETSYELYPPEPDGENDWYISDVKVTLTATDDTSRVNYTMYNLDETGWIEYTVSFTVTTDGSHTVEYYSVDMAGNVESNKSVSFKIDQTSPEIELTVEKQGFRILWLFTADVRDETSGVNRVEFYYDDELLGTVTEKPYEWEYSGDSGENATAIVYDHAGNSAEDEKPVSYSQSQSSSSTPVQRAFLSNSESTVDSKLEDTSNADSITDAKPNEITVNPEPELDVGRVWLRGLLWRCNRVGNVNHAMALRLHYIELTPTERTDGMVTMNRVAFKDSAYTGRMYEVGAGLFTYVFGFFKGGLEII